LDVSDWRNVGNSCRRHCLCRRMYAVESILYAVKCMPSNRFHNSTWVLTIVQPTLSHFPAYSVGMPLHDLGIHAFRMSAIGVMLATRVVDTAYAVECMPSNRFCMPSNVCLRIVSTTVLGYCPLSNRHFLIFRPILSECHYMTWEFMPFGCQRLA